LNRTQRSKKKIKGSQRTEIQLPQLASPAALAAFNKIQTLWRALRYKTEGKILEVFMHAQLLALSIGFFAKVRQISNIPGIHPILSLQKSEEDFPETAPELGRALASFVLLLSVLFLSLILVQTCS